MQFFRYSTLGFIALLYIATLALSGCVTKKYKDFDFVVVADTAYSVPEDYPAYYGLIDRINRAKPAFTLHLGDTRGGGGGDCSDESLQKVKEDFARFDHPLIYTPGDNEWTDCHTQKAGGFDPLDRLTAIRRIYFEGNPILGRGQFTRRVQTDSGAGLIENAMWEKGGVVFASLHIVGSNNGWIDNKSPDGGSEYQSRQASNKQWLLDTFEQANKVSAKAIVISFHANIFYRNPSISVPDVYAEIRNLIGELGGMFGKPVLVMHGDHHAFIVDRPYLGADGASLQRNITRLQTYGWPDAKAIKVHVTPSSEGVFTYTPIYAGNGLYAE